MKTNRIVIASLGVLLSSITIAGTMGPVVDGWSRVMTLSLGPVVTEAGDAHTFFLTPQIEKTYTANEGTQTLGAGEFFYGYQHPISCCRLWGQLGLAVAAAGVANMSGSIWDDADPAFDNYHYEYNVSHAHVAVKGKLIVPTEQGINPYASGSIGVGFNRAYGFTNTPKIFEAVANPNFADRTTSSLAYTLGVGLEQVINPHLRIGIGYEFADWGKSQLGRAFGQTLGTGLSIDNIYTNGLLVGFSYVS